MVTYPCQGIEAAYRKNIKISYLGTKWHKKFYRMVDGYDPKEHNSNFKEMREVEQRIFINIKEDIIAESKSGKWENTREQNEYTDQKIR